METQVENLQLEQRLSSALKAMDDNAGWRYPLDIAKCAAFIEGCTRYLAMQPEEILAGSGSLGHGGHAEKYNHSVVKAMMDDAQKTLDKYNPPPTDTVSLYAGIDFGIENNYRCRY